MPTGYTAELMDKGQDFRNFVLTCARAFGATIMQRDDPLSELPKKQEPGNYHTEQLAAAISELARLNAMTSDERFDFGEKRKSEAITSTAEGLQRDKAANARIDAMMEKVCAWTPPTAEHASLKSFMIEQLTISRNSLDYYEKELAKVTRKSGRAFFDEAFQAAQHSIEYHRTEAAKEKERVDGRNEWIEQLYESL